MKLKLNLIFFNFYCNTVFYQVFHKTIVSGIQGFSINSTRKIFTPLVTFLVTNILSSLNPQVYSYSRHTKFYFLLLITKKRQMELSKIKIRKTQLVIIVIKSHNGVTKVIV